MREIASVVIMFVGVASNAFATFGSTPGPNKWFVPSDSGLGYGSRPPSETPVASNYPTPIGIVPPIFDCSGWGGTCECNLSRICAAKFTTT